MRQLVHQPCGRRQEGSNRGVLNRSQWSGNFFCVRLKFGVNETNLFLTDCYSLSPYFHLILILIFLQVDDDAPLKTPPILQSMVPDYLHAYHHSFSSLFFSLVSHCLSHSLLSLSISLSFFFSLSLSLSLSLYFSLFRRHSFLQLLSRT